MVNNPGDSTVLSRNIAAWQDPAQTWSFIKGRVALYAILKAAGVGPGDEVVIPGFTCVVVPAAVRYLGAEPVFHDINPFRLNGDPDLASKLIGPRTKAVLVQHTFGNVADLGELPEICRREGLLLVEDCAHAVGAGLGSSPVGTLGDASFMSLQWSKIASTGLGGIARVNNPELANKLNDVYQNDIAEPRYLKSMVLHVLSTLHHHFYRPEFFWKLQDAYRWAGSHGLVPGSSGRGELDDDTMPEGYCERFGQPRSSAMKRVLSPLPGQLVHRRRLAAFYTEQLAATGCFLPEVLPGSTNVSLRFPVLVHNRDTMLEVARAERLEWGDWFDAPLHPRQANSCSFGYREGRCPRSEWVAARLLNLPTHPKVSDAEAQRLVTTLIAEGDLVTRDQITAMMATEAS